MKFEYKNNKHDSTYEYLIQKKKNKQITSIDSSGEWLYGEGLVENVIVWKLITSEWTFIHRSSAYVQNMTIPWKT